MSEASFASLGPTLLARKGGAKPAMRPQLAPLPEMVADEQLEDLGWNDMGQDDENAPETGADIVSISPSAQKNARAIAASQAANEDLATHESPLVLRQQRDLADRLLVSAETETHDTASQERLIKAKPAKERSPASQSSFSASRRAAFTLRLDTERHLKLRLAATMQGISAQALVTEALDAMLSEIDDLDALAQRFKGRTKHN